jgi:glycosyltransferase involved in cell wall biosynthesis
MKIIQILPELNSGGVERGTLEVAAHLVKHGHEAVVISNGGRLVAALEASGARHVTMPVHRKSLATLLQVMPLRKFLTQEKPDILHIRSRVPGWIAWLAWRGMDPATRPRLVSTVHGFYSPNAYSAVMTKGERVIAVSDSIRKYILKNYPKTAAEKITVIHRGVDPGQFPKDYRPSEAWMSAWETAYPEIAGRKTLLLPARITRWKGQIDFLRVVSGLINAGEDVHGLIAGETHRAKATFENELRELAGQLGISDRVTFLGHRSDLKEVMAVADVVLSLSLDPEAFGRVTLEAAALGKPVVAYDHGGVAEQLQSFFPDGLVPVGDVPEMIHRITRLLAPDHPSPGPIDEFTLGNMLEKTTSLYNSLLPH